MSPGQHTSTGTGQRVLHCLAWCFPVLWCRALRQETKQERLWHDVGGGLCVMVLRALQVLGALQLLRAGLTACEQSSVALRLC